MVQLTLAQQRLQFTVVLLHTSTGCIIVVARVLACAVHHSEADCCSSCTKDCFGHPLDLNMY